MHFGQVRATSPVLAARLLDPREEVSPTPTCTLPTRGPRAVASLERLSVSLKPTCKHRLLRDACVALAAGHWEAPSTLRPPGDWMGPSMGPPLSTPPLTGPAPRRPGPVSQPLASPTFSAGPQGRRRDRVGRPHAPFSLPTPFPVLHRLSAPRPTCRPRASRCGWRTSEWQVTWDIQRWQGHLSPPTAAVQLVQVSCQRRRLGRV